MENTVSEPIDIPIKIRSKLWQEIKLQFGHPKIGSDEYIIMREYYIQKKKEKKKPTRPTFPETIAVREAITTEPNDTVLTSSKDKKK